ncbi:MAG: hypothetical protein WBC22_17320 [Sedimentisphaerales bacterium]
MRRTLLISMLVSLVLWLAGCTIVEEHYVRRGPRPYVSLSRRTYRGPMPPPRVHRIRPGGPTYELRHR